MWSYEFPSNEWDFGAVKKQIDRGSDKHGHSQDEEQSFVALNLNTQDREMANDGAGHYPDSECGAQPNETWRQDKQRGDQFHDSGTDAPPGLQPDLRKDVDRLGRSGELEEKRLKKDTCRGQPENPAKY
jgi:hypothetical protein